MTASERTAAAKARAVAIARKVLSGEMSAILGARAMRSLCSAADELERDPDLLAISAIESETDALPVGAERAEWDPGVLELRAAEIAEAERWALDDGRLPFESIARRWSGGAAEQPDAADAARWLVGVGWTVYLQSAARGAADPCVGQT